ncbi:MAG: hypothetical protein QOG62_920 [Thermoleophilaceae bacterium]|jgi:AcrR family transcriptional regulator|nr:hypothetical protein [Thermoleophilaceae bacterium]
MPVRRTQEERRTRTRGQIVQAMIECLNEYGYSGATYARVADRAGVSRGAMLHYFPDKVELAVAAADYVRQDGVDRVAARVPSLPAGPGRTAEALDLCREVFGGPLFHAAMEVWLRGRTEQPLGDRMLPVRAQTIENIAQVMPALFGDHLANRDDLPELARLLAATLRGLALEDRREGDQPETWAYVRERLATLVSN